MKEEKTVNLIECFNTFQGEGPDSGQAMTILRFKYCNLDCSWCDTKVKMRISMEAPYKIKNIQENIINSRAGLLITGGEPTITKHFEDTLTLINNLEYPIANVESNGHRLYKLISRADPTKNVHYIYSPKIFNKKDLEIAKKKTVDLLYNFANVVFIKIVYENNMEILNYIQWLSSYIKLDITYFNNVWIMPEGTNRAALIRNASEVFDICEKYRFNFSSRSHIIYDFV